MDISIIVSQTGPSLFIKFSKFIFLVAVGGESPAFDKYSLLFMTKSLILMS